MVAVGGCGVAVAVAEGVTDGVSVAVGEGVSVGVGVGVSVGVAVGGGSVAVGDGVCVAVGVSLGSGRVGVADWTVGSGSGKAVLVAPTPHPDRIMTMAVRTRSGRMATAKGLDCVIARRL
jgi:hypothetical protein